MSFAPLLRHHVTQSKVYTLLPLLVPPTWPLHISLCTYASEGLWVPIFFNVDCNACGLYKCIFYDVVLRDIHMYSYGKSQHNYVHDISQLSSL